MSEKKLRIYMLCFSLAFVVHLLGLNQIGRTWDEEYKVDAGFIAWDRMLAHDFSLNAWNDGTEHPMVAKYLYGFFLRPELIYLQGPTGTAPLSPDEIALLKTGNYLQTSLWDSTYAAPYDYT